MEDGLGPTIETSKQRVARVVLILVLMEYGLGQSLLILIDV